jgi:hypothetical protein
MRPFVWSQSNPHFEVGNDDALKYMRPTTHMEKLYGIRDFYVEN